MNMQNKFILTKETKKIYINKNKTIIKKKN